MKKGKRNISEDFEAIYLRYNMIKKHMPRADKAELDKPDFKKAVKYMASKYYGKHRDLFASNGFEYEDILSIVTVFGLTYMGLEVVIEDDRNGRAKYLIMMRYISQRMNNLIRWITKKFNTDDAWVVTMDKFSGVVDRHSAALYKEIDIASEEDLLVVQQDAMEALNSQLSQDRGNAELLAEKSDVMTSINKTRKQITKKNKKRKSLLSKLRKKLDAKPEKYLEQLCYYATTKHTSRDVRRKARGLCRKYGIDYIEWLKKKSENPNFDPTQFTF